MNFEGNPDKIAEAISTKNPRGIQPGNPEGIPAATPVITPIGVPKKKPRWHLWKEDTNFTFFL